MPKLVQPEVPGSSIGYDVTPQEGGGQLHVTVTLPPRLPGAFEVDSPMLGWVKSPEVETVSGWAKVPFDGAAWKLAGCESGCRVKYQFDLAGAAQGADDEQLAAAFPGAFVAPASSWLLRPSAEISGVPYRLHVKTSPDVGFVTGVLPVADGAESTYGSDVSDLPESPYSAFGRFRVEHPSHHGGVLDTAIVNGPIAAGDALLLRWIEEGAGAVAAYYGRFPMKRAALIVIVEDGDGVGRGTALGKGGGGIAIHVGREIAEKRLLHSWVLTHEMLHLAFPGVDRRQHWLEEGISTYVETVARARTGEYGQEEAWAGLVNSMHYGLPEEGDGGLDDTPTWGHTYWGGALFCLLADVRIREQTGDKKSLDDALVAILDQGGDGGARWPIERVVEVGDKATGTTVLHDLYAEMGKKALKLDLDAFWARLGIKRSGDGLSFDDTAPLAAIRKSITTTPPKKGSGP